MTNGNIKEMECPNCHLKYKREANFKKHKCPWCKTCSTLFSTYQKLQQHSCSKSCKIKEKSIKHECNQCHKQYCSVRTLANHKCTWCPICLKKYPSFKRFQSHKCKMNNSTMPEPNKECTADTKPFMKQKMLIPDIENSTTSESSTNPAFAEHNLEPKTLGACVENATTGTSESSTKSAYPERNLEPKTLGTCVENATTSESSTNPAFAEHNLEPKTLGTCVENATTSESLTKSADPERNLEPMTLGTCVENATTSESSTNSAYTEPILKPASICNTTRTNDIIVIKESTCKMGKFKRVSFSWQLQKCEALQLPIVHILPEQSTSQIMAGSPKIIKKIIGDGNCFFRCISYLITGNESFHGELRALVVTHMYNIKADVERFCLPSETTMEQYVCRSKIDVNGTWATDVEIFSAAHLLKTDICVYTFTGKASSWLKYSASSLERNLQIDEKRIYINHTHGNHYDVVLESLPEYISNFVSNEFVESRSVCNDMLVKELNRQFAIGEFVRENTKPKCNSGNEYMKNYMKRKRADPKFCKLENQRKRQRKTMRTDNEICMERLRSQKRRQSGNYREEEKMKEKVYKKKHAAENLLRKQQRKSDPQYRMKEAALNRKRKTQKRSDPQYHLKEAALDIKRKSKKRSDPQYHLKEAALDTKRKTKKRSDPQYHLKEAALETKHKTKKRSDPQYHLKEAALDRKRKTKKRSDPKYHLKEAAFDRKRKTNKRSDPQYHLKEAALDRKRKTKKRNDPQYHLKEAAFDRKCKTNKRSDPQYHLKDAANDRKGKSLKRNDPKYRIKEALIEQKGKLRRRNDPIQRKKERLQDKQRKLERRKCKYFKLKESTSKEKVKSKKNLNLKELIDKFNFDIRVGPEFICSCCFNLFYRHAVNLVLREKMEQKGISPHMLDTCLTRTISCADSEWICKTCYNSLRANKIPVLAQANGLVFPDIPSPLKDLTLLEERCVSPRIPFMQLRELGRDHQYGIRGNVVNVPVNVAATVSKLPRKFCETETIQLKFMRRMQYKTPYHFETVRPKIIFEAAKWLIENSQLYREEGLDFDPQWFKEEWNNGSTVKFIVDEERVEAKSTKEHNEDEIITCAKNKEENSIVPDNKQWEERSTEEQLETGNMDTLLHPVDFTDDGQHALKIAPGEDNQPIGIFLDEFCEEKSFPSIFCGKPRMTNADREVSISYSDICKSELRSADRRAAMSVPNLFFKLKKLQTLQIRDMAMTALRKTKGSKDYTAGQLRKEGSLEQLLHVNEGYRILKTLRSSPPYWQARQKDLMAMVRQLGLPTFFATFSAAETRWVELLKILSRTVDGKDIDISNYRDLSWQERVHLIQSDPVTCARHFDHRWQKFFHTVLNSRISPLGKIVESFCRVEFQQRGSPHVHCLFWVEAAPQYRIDKTDDVVAFIDKYITCKKHQDSQMTEVAKLHEHKHSPSCRKKGKDLCRFGFPIPPMSKTEILKPLPESMKAADVKRHHLNYKHVVSQLEKMRQGVDISLECFLCDIKLSHEEYILAVRSSLKKDKIFIQRSPNEIRMNMRNDVCALIWQANCDVQFVLDPFACVVYILSYISKSQRGMGTLLQAACEDAKKGNYGIKEQVKIIGNKFLNHCEISAQEAVYLLLQLPLCRASRDAVFVNTSPADERVVIIKRKSALDILPEDSTDVACSGLIDRYMLRPKELNSISLAEFATCYEWKSAYHTKRKKSSQIPEDEYKEDFVDDPNHEEQLPIKYHIMHDGSVLYRRKKAKILRCVRYTEAVDPINYYRELLMLYLPWRDEENDMLLHFPNYEERYKMSVDAINENRSKYESNAEEIKHALEEIVDEENCENAWDKIAPNTRESDVQLVEDGSNMIILAPNKAQHSYYDIGGEIGCPTDVRMAEDILNDRIPQNEFEDIMRSLNIEQRKFTYHILKEVKTGRQGFCYFLSGGAGVGKSRCLLAIYHAVLRYYDTLPGGNPDEKKVILSAPTGKAAFNIHGTTLHSTFLIPANSQLQYVQLDQSRLNTLRTKFRGIQLIIIDEISMVGANMFNFINLRLQDITGSKKLLGGVNLLLVGDLFQLRPVMDKWIFQCVQSDYSALAPCLWTELVTMFELTQVMRQKDDVDFASTLNRIREGNQLNEDINLIGTRVIDKSSYEQNNMLHLFTSHKLVDRHNEKMLNALETKGLHIHAHDVALGNASSSVKDVLLTRAAELKVQLTQNLMYDLHVKESARYMLIHNVDTTDGLTNGATCILKSIGSLPGQTSKRPTVLWLLFDENSIGVKARSDNSHLYHKGIQPVWTPVFEICRRFRIGRHQNIEILRRQFPIQPSAAITVHKSQGSSLDAVVLSFEGMVQAHLIYVALSRVRTLSGLHLLDFRSEKITVAAEVKEEMKRLRNKQIPWSLYTLADFCEQIVIVFHNSRSLHKHIADLRCEEDLLNADLIVVQESWEKHNDDISHYFLPNFKILSNGNLCRRNMTKSHRPHGGTIIYCRNRHDIDKREAVSYTINEIEVVEVNLNKIANNLKLISIYRSPNVKFKCLIDTLGTILKQRSGVKDRTVIGGDFNVDISREESVSKELLDFMLAHHFEQLINIESSTTNYGSTLDVIFTNCHVPQMTADILECWYSDHKPIFVAVTPTQ